MECGTCFVSDSCGPEPEMEVGGPGAQERGRCGSMVCILQLVGPLSLGLCPSARSAGTLLLLAKGWCPTCRKGALLPPWRSVGRALCCLPLMPGLCQVGVLLQCSSHLAVAFSLRGLRGRPALPRLRGRGFRRPACQACTPAPALGTRCE